MSFSVEQIGERRREVLARIARGRAILVERLSVGGGYAVVRLDKCLRVLEEYLVNGPSAENPYGDLRERKVFILVEDLITVYYHS